MQRKRITMKKRLFFILIGAITYNSSVAQDTIPNAGFEDWTGAAVDQPVGWGTANNIHIQLNGCVTKATAPADIHSGSSGITLNTVQVSSGGQVWRVAGTAVSGGQINQTYPFITGGIPYTLKPTHLNGYAKYLPQQSPELLEGNPVGIDQSNVEVYLFRWNGSSRDTLGYGQWSPSSATFSKFTVDIIYDSLLSGTPDTMQIIMASSRGVETATGSMLFVDSLSVDTIPGIVGIDELAEKLFDLGQNAPNPFTENTEITFSSTINETIQFTVIDVLGREVYSIEINAAIGENKISFNGRLDAGTYFYSVSNDNYRATKKMVVSE